MSITKHTAIPEKIQKELLEKGIDDLSIGNVYLKGNYIYRITNVNKDKYGNLQIHVDKAQDSDATKWERYCAYTTYDWNSYDKPVLITKTVKEHREEALKLINGEITLSDYGSSKEEEEINEETALIGGSSKQSLITLKEAMLEKKKSAETLQAFVKYEMEKKQAALRKVLDEVAQVVTVWQKKIKKIMKVIATIELYLGVNEEIFQIQEGEVAPIDTPISFRQLILFMDEEVANTEDGGLDFDQVHLFDEWLLKNENYKNLLPEEKGVVVFKPRRSDKQYAKDDNQAFEKNLNNKYNTYLLIRNGECVYRIYTDHLYIAERLFPRKAELAELLKEFNARNNSLSVREEEELEDIVSGYRKQAILMQGLVDRTEILHPLPISNLSLFNLEGAEHCVNFVYDDEAALTDGRPSFRSWLKEINQKIDYGSRVVLTALWRSDGYTSRDIVEDRGFKYYSNKYNVPASPSAGLYEIQKYQERHTKYFFDRDSEETKKQILEGKWQFLEKRNSNCDKYYKFDEKIHLVIKYNPGGEVWKGWGHGSEERKNRIAFRVFKDDTFVMNYDQISLDDINYYLQNRVDRKNYLEMMPLLREMKKWRLEELKNERNFALLVLGELIRLYPKVLEDSLRKSIDELIEWWKFKNQYKRPIDKDDAKALRMIVAQYKRINK
jgi:hypothetical protein